MSAGSWHAAGAARMAQAVRSREVTAGQRVRECMARIEATDARINAFTDLTTPRALARAEEIDAMLAGGDRDAIARNALAHQLARGNFAAPDGLRHACSAGRVP